MTVDPAVLDLATQVSVVGALGYAVTTAVKKWVAPARRSLVCFLVALVASVVWEMLTGKDWIVAIAAGLGGGTTFIGIHEMLTKGIQGDAKPKLAG